LVVAAEVLFGYEIEVFFIPVYVIYKKKKKNQKKSKKIKKIKKKKSKKKKMKRGQECPQKRPKMPTPFLLLAHKRGRRCSQKRPKLPKKKKRAQDATFSLPLAQSWLFLSF
jgi:hypothetical protein